MKLVIKFILLFGLATAFANPINEALLLTAKTKGISVYATCVVSPPVDPTQQAVCVTLYTAYIVSLQALNAPLPLVLSLNPSPYAWSPYDVCRYEPTPLVFNIPVTQPYCPSI
jgi:hypothetical protein